MTCHESSFTPSYSQLLYAGAEVEQWRKLIEKKKSDSFQIWCWKKALRMSWTIRKKNKWVLEQNKPETSLEANMTKLKLSYYEHIMRRHDVLEKMMMLGKQQGKRKTKYKLDWLHKSSHSVSLQELGRAAEDRTLCTSLFPGLPGVRANLQQETHIILAHTIALGNNFCKFINFHIGTTSIYRPINFLFQT